MVGGDADSRCCAAALFSAQGQARYLVWRQVVGVGQLLTRLLGTVMGSQRLMVEGKERHKLGPAAHAYLGALWHAEGHRIVSVVEGDMPVSAHCRLFPDRQVIGCLRQGLEPMLLA